MNVEEGLSSLSSSEDIKEDIDRAFANIEDINNEIEIIKKDSLELETIKGIDALVELSHGSSLTAGWWNNPDGTPIENPNIAEKICLIHSELSEAMEGVRKDLMDDKLPHRPMVEVELADALIRIGDLAGYLKIDLAGATVEKMQFNKTREDHKLENRLAAGGKKF